MSFGPIYPGGNTDIVANLSDIPGDTLTEVLNAIKTQALQPRDVRTYTDFFTDAYPAPIGNDIFLAAGSSWRVIGDVDLQGNKLTPLGACSIGGDGQETSILRSTGLPAGQAVISTAFSLTLLFLAIYADAGRVCTRIDGTGQPSLPALDWVNVNFNTNNLAGAGRALELRNISNAIFNTLGVFGDGVYLEAGEAGTVAFNNTIFLINSTRYGFQADAGATLRGRFRANVSRFITLAPDAMAIDAPSAIFVDENDDPTSETFILDQCAFVGANPTPVTGTLVSQDTARWDDNRGIENSTRRAGVHWTGNTNTTTVPAAGTFVPAVSPGAPNVITGIDTQHFTVDPATGEATYTSELEGKFLVAASVSFYLPSQANNKIIAARILKNGATITDGRVMRSTSNGAGRAEGFPLFQPLSLVKGDTIQLAATNETDTAAFVVEDFSMDIFQTR